MLTIGEALTGSAKRHPSKPAVVFGNAKRSFLELEQQCRKWAHAMMRQGLSAGDRVALLLPNGLEMVDAYFSTALAGIVAVPMNLRWAPAELLYVLEDAKPRMIIAGVEFEPLFRQAAAFQSIPIFYTRNDGSDDDWFKKVEESSGDYAPVATAERDPWVMVYTSGTTGRPKGAIRDHYSNLMIALILVSELGITPDDVGLAILPMFHVNSMWFVTLSLVIGATCVIYPHRNIHPQTVLAEMGRHGVSYSMFVPTLLTFLADAVEHGHPVPEHLRVMMTASAPLDGTLRDRLLTVFPHAQLFDIYGATEIGAVTLIRHHRDGPLGSVGFPAVGQEIRILDPQSREPLPAGTVGEVFVRGPSLMQRYFGHDDATREAFTPDGFLTVGDMGYLSPEGLLYLVDRIQDMIIVAGENVYPVEVERVLLSHPSVAMAVAVGIPDPLRGQRVAAIVVAREGREVAVAELFERCRQNLADFKRPIAIEVAAELPIGATGKVIRRVAREEYLRRHSEPREGHRQKGPSGLQ